MQRRRSAYHAAPMASETRPGSSAAIRRARGTDAAKLAEITAATFVETFAHLYPPQDLHRFLQEKSTPEACARLLAEPGVAAWFISAADDVPRGYVVVGPCKLPVENLEPLAGELRQLYIRAEFQSHQLGSGLLTTALEWLDAQQRCPLYVGVWSENHGAQRLYARRGFVKVGEYGFKVGASVDHEFILKRTGSA